MSAESEATSIRGSFATSGNSLALEIHAYVHASSARYQKPFTKKYFNFMAKYDLEKLWDQGVSGVKVKVFGTSMDTPGRADLLG